MEIKFTPSQLHFPKISKNPLLLIRVASGILVLGILVFLGISFYGTVYTAVLTPKPIEENQLTSQQAVLDVSALDLVTRETAKKKGGESPVVIHDLFAP